MKHLKKSLPYLSILGLVYVACPWLAQYLLSDEGTLKAFLLSHILLYQPLVVFLLCLIYASRHGWTAWLAPVMGLFLLPVDAFVYPHADGLAIYCIPYTLIGYLGLFIGWIIFRHRHKKT